jgi:hypothetical protein
MALSLLTMASNGAEAIRTMNRISRKRVALARRFVLRQTHLIQRFRDTVGNQ